MGWFAAAGVLACLIGTYFNPLGWTIAAGLAAVISVGVAWPWVAVRAVKCHLSPQFAAVHEGDTCGLRLRVHNRLPIPMWGLAVEGYLDGAEDFDGRERSEVRENRRPPLPTVALSSVRGGAESEYRLDVRPMLRGSYPVETPKLSCSFPFGIWTARRKMRRVEPLRVWPRVYPITGRCPATGDRMAEIGQGGRGGTEGEFVGVRPYRDGDPMRNVHWSATARADALIVVDRGNPRSPSVTIRLDASPAGGREDLSDRVRIAASLAANLHAGSSPVTILWGGRAMRVRPGAAGRREMLDALSDIPHRGIDGAAVTGETSGDEVVVRSGGVGVTEVMSRIGDGGGRRGDQGSHRSVRGNEVAEVMRRFWEATRR